MKRSLLLLLAAAAALASCSRSQTASTPTMDAEHYLATFVDTTVSPRQNFFEYSVGKWLKDNPIPPSERSWGIAHVVQEETYHRLVSLSEAARDAKPAHGTNAQKIGDFWYAAMDTTTIAKQGITPLAPEFAKIDSVHDINSLVDAVARLQYIGVGALCALGISQD